MLFGGIYVHFYATEPGTGTEFTNEDDAALSQHIIGGITTPMARTAGCIYHTEHR